MKKNRDKLPFEKPSSFIIGRDIKIPGQEKPDIKEER